MSAKQANKRDDDRDAADAESPPGGVATAAAPSMRSKIVELVMARRGGTETEAANYADRKLAGRSVVNELAWIRACLDNEASASVVAVVPDVAPTAKAKPAGKAKNRRADSFSPDEIAAAVAAFRGGEAKAAISRRLTVTPAAVAGWCNEAGKRDAVAAVLDGGELIDDAAARFGADKYAVRAQVENARWPLLLAAVQTGEKVEDAAARLDFDVVIARRRIKHVIIAAIEGGAMLEDAAPRFGVEIEAAQRWCQEDAYWLLYRAWPAVDESSIVAMAKRFGVTYEVMLAWYEDGGWADRIRNERAERRRNDQRLRAQRAAS